MKKASIPLLLSILSLNLIAADSPDPGYVAHEWGTFTSVLGSDGKVIRWNSLATSVLPDFVYSRTRPFHDVALDNETIMLAGKTDGFWEQRMETPVIYFHSDRPRTLDVRVDFPRGLVTEWYPQVSGFGPSPGLSSLVPKTTNSFASWDKVAVSAETVTDSEYRALKKGQAPNHYYHAREASASLLQTSNALGKDSQNQQERFLFYRGVGNFSTPLKVTMDPAGAKLRLANSGKQGLNHLFLLTVKDGLAGFARLPQIPAGGSQETQLSLVDKKELVSLNSQQLSADLARVLEAEGLFADEAIAMVKTWRESWLEEEGTRVLYLLPREWTDQTLPLTLKPAPKKLVRVMVGRAEILTPKIEGELLARFSQFSHPASREQAIAGIQALKLGRFMEPAFARLREMIPVANATPEEVARPVYEFQSAVQSRANAQSSQSVKDKSVALK